MANYYVYHGAAGNDSGSDWTNAAPDLLTVSASATNADTIYIASDHVESQTTSKLITFPTSAGLKVISSDRTSGTPPTTATAGASIEVGAANISLTVIGFAYIYGVNWLAATNNSSLSTLNIASTTVSQGLSFDTCVLDIRTVNATPRCFIGPASQSGLDDVYVSFKNCTFKFGNVGQSISIRYGRMYFENITISASGSTPTTVFETLTGAGCDAMIVSSNLASVTWTNLVSVVAAGSGSMKFINCRMPSGWNARTGTEAGIGGLELSMFGCASGDTHLDFYYSNAIGSLTIDSTNKVTAGVAGLSWKITTSAVASWNNPFVTPYVDLYHAGASEITPYLECLRNNGTATVYNNDQVWGEFSVKTDAGYSNSVVYSDGIATPVTTAAAQTAGVGTGSWTIASSNSPASFKIDSGASVTPDEVGYIRARVFVAVPSLAGTLYIDPQIRT